MKRVFDLIAATLALLFLLPAFTIVAVAIAAETGRPIFFQQSRMGLHGKIFGMLKFRSMVKDAAQQGPYYTSSNDHRITRVGRFIRRNSIDELPQLINVLKGDMSLVGPRPDVPQQVEQYAPRDWAERCSVLPGITGWAQAAFRSEGTESERLALDLRYVREARGLRGFFLDIKIMWWTLGRITGRGSN